MNISHFLSICFLFFLSLFLVCVYVYFHGVTVVFLSRFSHLPAMAVPSAFPPCANSRSAGRNSCETMSPRFPESACSNSCRGAHAMAATNYFNSYPTPVAQRKHCALWSRFTCSARLVVLDMFLLLRF